MPTILTIYGLRVVIYPNDHRPAHIHVIGKDHEAVFNLHCLLGSPRLRENYGFSRKDIANIVRELAANLARLCDQWRRIHEYD